MNIHLLRAKDLIRQIFFTVRKIRPGGISQHGDNSVPEGPPPSCLHQMVGGVIMEEKGWETCDACGLESDRG